MKLQQPTFVKKFKPNHHSALLQKQAHRCLNQYQITLLEPANFRPEQLASIRKLLKKILGKTEKVWFDSTAKHPLTAKPVGIRIGKGKGLPVINVKPLNAGAILGAFSFRSTRNLSKLKRAIQARSPVRLRFRNDTGPKIFQTLNINQLWRKTT